MDESLTLTIKGQSEVNTQITAVKRHRAELTAIAFLLRPDCSFRPRMTNNI